MKKFLRILGPGLLYAGAAIGVSHLVQSTKAGALFNYDLIWILILANILKYPFFEFGARYANATGKSLVDGYARIGKWAVILFTFLTISSMFIFQAAITVVTVGLLANILNIEISIGLLSLLLLGVSALILLIGRYSLLDKVIKFVIVLLSVSTIVAVFAAFGIEKVVRPESILHFQWTRSADIFFMIAFVGWMPAPIDISVWSSVWGIAKAKELKYTPSLKDTLLEFKVGYISTMILAICFVLLGAQVLWGSGEVLSPKGTVFASQLIKMYTSSIGEWSYWIIALAAFTTMFSTTITVLDAYPRVLGPIYTNLLSKKEEPKYLRIFLIVILIIGTYLIIVFLAKSMAHMVNFATTLSFITAPVLAWLNYRVVTDKHMPIDARPGIGLRILSWIGIVFFIIFTLIYFYMQIIP